MSEYIKDGTGSGNLVEVSSTNRLHTSSRVNERVYYASRDNQSAYFIQFELTQVSGGATEGVGYITYTGSNRLNIKEITFTSEDSGMTKFGLWQSPTVSGGTTSIPVNTNFSSNILPDIISAENADGTVLTITGGNSLYTVRINGPSSLLVDFHDAIILGSNNTIAVKASASTTGSKVRVNILFHEAIE